MKYVRVIFLLYLIEITVSHLENELVYKPCIDILDLAQKDGYDGDRHVIRSVDGYDTEVFRIVLGSPQLINRKNPVVLIERGYMGDKHEDAHYFNLNLVYYLAYIGYDVWLGTYRNDTYNRQLTLKKKNILITVGATDITAAIKYILVATKQNTITLVGQFLGWDLYSLRYLMLETKYQEMVKLIIVTFTNPINSKNIGLLPYKIYKLLKNQNVHSQDKIVQINQTSRHFFT